MRKEAVDHLTSVIMSSILEHGNSYMEHIPEMFKNWKGPLDDDNVFLYRSLIRNFGKKNVEKVMGKLNNLVIHPLFDRDFFQGVMDGLGHHTGSRRICFYNHPELREFIESSEHRFNIKFENSRVENKNRTLTLPFLSLPCRGEKDKYFAGVLSSALPFINKDGEVFCRVNKECEPVLKSLGILYRGDKEKIFITAFYLMIFCGDLPEPIYRKWIALLTEHESVIMREAGIEALINWRITFGGKPFFARDIPYLQSRSYYHSNLAITMEKIDEYMKEKKFDFVDERVQNRIKRWYNTHVPQKGPIYSSKLA